MADVIFIGIVGPSNSGKTTIMTELVRLIKQRGLTVATIKHSHHNLNLPAKDSTKYLEAGADFSLALGNNGANLSLPRGDRSAKEWAAWLFPDADVVLVEGWRSEGLPSIIVGRTKPTDDWRPPSNILGYIGWAPKEAISYENAAAILKELL
jgi:molybdopterin-guanine dinucleotide biosynthesis protein B